MKTSLRVKRYNPEDDKNGTYFEEFSVDMEEYNTVLDALIAVREYEDESLAVRCSCRGSICGSCGIRVNGNGALACKTKILSVAPNEEMITVEPMGNMPVLRDLVTDMTPFWDKLRGVEPWLQVDGPEPEGEYIASPDAMTHLNGVMSCIMCGVCVSDCTSLEVFDQFVGPAALAKAYRFVADPRDEADLSRLGALNEPGGIWDCTRCMACVQVCPKGVAPMERIMKLRDAAIEAGFDNTSGARHAEVFTEIIKQDGHLDETMLTVGTIGMFNISRMMSLLPIAVRALLHRKLPLMYPFTHVSAGVTQIRKIFDHVEAKK